MSEFVFEEESRFWEDLPEPAKPQVQRAAELLIEINDCSDDPKAQALPEFDPEKELTSHYAQQLEELEQEAGLIDREEAERMLKALGITKVIACAYGTTNLFTPKRQGDAYDWDKVPATVDWDAVERDLKRPGTKNLGFISCPGGARVKQRKGKPAEIFECSLLVYEIDGLPKDKQWKLWEKAGIGEPTLVMDTGNNSLHVWFRLAEPVTPEQGRIARKRLSLAIEAVLLKGSRPTGQCTQPTSPPVGRRHPPQVG